MKKKGFELSISFIVVIIMGIVLLALGIILLQQFIGAGIDIKADLDERTERQLSELLEGGDQIALPFNRQTLSRGDANIFGLGILNIQFDPSAQFEVEVIFSNAVKKDGVTQIQNVPPVTEWARYDRGPFEIGFNQQRKEPIRMEVPTGVEGGTYVFNVKVYQVGGSQYDITKKIYITVP